MMISAKGIKHKSKNIKKTHTIPFHCTLWYILCQESTTKFLGDQFYTLPTKKLSKKLKYKNMRI